MESVDCLESGAPAYGVVEANAAAVATGPAPEAEWHSISLEELRSETEYCFLLSDGKKSSELSMCGLSKLIERDGEEDSSMGGHTTTSNLDCRYISIKSSEDCSGVKEVRVSIHGLDEPKNSASENVGYKTGSRGTGSKGMNESGSILRPGDDGCFPLIQQVRAFIKGAKLSCAGLLSGDGKPFLTYGWSSLLQRSFSFKSSETSSSESEKVTVCKKSNISVLGRATSAPTPASANCNHSGSETMKANPLQARDPASRAEALPLAHYRPTDGAIWKEGDAKTEQSILASKSSPVNCKKPPKPPRHPGRAASLDSAAMAAHRAARKSRDRASAKRKSRAASAAASTGLTPLVALVLTIGFGALMVFQGVFVQTNVSYGRNADGVFVDANANSRSTMPAQNVASYGVLHAIDPQLPASLHIDVRNSEAILNGALRKSMKDLPWSRSSLASQVKSSSG